MTATPDKDQSTYQIVVDGLGTPLLQQIEPRNNQVLVANYIRPEITKGGIILTPKTRDEDRWQGKAAFVLKKGPTAFVDAPENGVYFHGQNVEPGDVVVYRISDGFPLDVDGYHCRLIEDVAVRMSVPDPSIIF